LDADEQRDGSYVVLGVALVTPEIAGTALVELVRAHAATVTPGYRLSGAGLEKP